MINKVIKGLTKGEIKKTKANAFAFGFFEYPRTIKQAWQQFKTELWLRK
jgi:hypothetical protein